jgi:hypothetical protein
VQSPTDYQFVRDVVGETYPYYAYATLAPGDHWLQAKLGRLCFRLANHLQPAIVYDGTGTMAEYVQAGCRKAVITNSMPQQPVDMAILPCRQSYEPLRPCLHDNSILVYLHIYQDAGQWSRLQNDSLFNVTFDLYYCGIAVIDEHRSTNHYVINF